MRLLQRRARRSLLEREKKTPQSKKQHIPKDATVAWLHGRSCGGTRAWNHTEFEAARCTRRGGGSALVGASATCNISIGCQRRAKHRQHLRRTRRHSTCSVMMTVVPTRRIRMADTLVLAAAHTTTHKANHTHAHTHTHTHATTTAKHPTAN